MDDIITWSGVVLWRAVTTLRSVETQTNAWGFVLSVRRDTIAKDRESERERGNSEIGARTKRRIMANRLKFRESFSEEEHYICKHCTTMYIGGYIDKYRIRKNNENIIMNSTYITYEVMYNMCYLIFFFCIAIIKIFFLLRQAKSENTPLGLRNSPGRDPGMTRKGKCSRSDMTGQEFQE